MRSNIHNRLKVNQILPVLFAYTKVFDIEMCFVVYYILLTLYSQQTSILVKLQNDTNVIPLQYRTKYLSMSTTWYR